jgi:hypothetical protein
MSEPAQLIAAGVIFAGFVAVLLLGRRRRAGAGPQGLIGTGSLVGQGDGTAVFVCDLCLATSQPSRSEALLRSWADQHAAQYHPTYVR